MHIMNGMTREAAQELSGWKSPAVMKAVYNRTRLDEVLPEMRAAVAKACAKLDVTAFVEDLDRDTCRAAMISLSPTRVPRCARGFAVSVRCKNS